MLANLEGPDLSLSTDINEGRSFDAAPSDDGDITEEERNRLIAMNAEARRRIFVAFADTQYPGDDAIHIAGKSFDEALPFLGKTWQEVSLLADPYSSNGIWQLFDSAFRYFLPTFMIGTLDDVDSRSIAVHFIPPYCQDAIYDWHDFTGRFDGLTAAQNECVAFFLEYYYDDYGPQSQYACVKSFWDNPVFPEELGDNLCAPT